MAVEMRIVRLLPLLLLAPAAAAEPVLLDRVVAVYSPTPDGTREVITFSDLERETRIALAARGALEAADGELSPEALGAALEWLLSELLVMQEAELLDLAQVDVAEVNREVEAFVSRFDSEEAYQAFLRRHEIAPHDVFRAARRRLVVGRYLDSRIRLAGSVSAGEVRAAYEQRRAEPGDMAGDEARHLLRAQLEKERREEVVAGLVQGLRSRAGVRILHRFGG